MDALSSAGGSASAPAAQAEDLALLKAAQDLAKQQGAALLETLPPPASPSPPGVGSRIDITA